MPHSSLDSLILVSVDDRSSIVIALNMSWKSSGNEFEEEGTEKYDDAFVELEESIVSDLLGKQTFK